GEHHPLPHERRSAGPGRDRPGHHPPVDRPRGPRGPDRGPVARAAPGERLNVELRVGRDTAHAYTGGRALDPRRPAVVFLHGGELDHSVWILQSRYLAHHGYAVLAADLPGHGRSGGAALARGAGLPDWTVALLDAAGVKDASLVGHSMGSLVALDCAARHPQRVRRIALVGTAFPMRVSAELLEATRANEPEAHLMINHWSHSALAHYPSNPGPGFWVAGSNLRL